MCQVSGLLTLALGNFSDKLILTGWIWILQIVGMKNPGEKKPDYTKNWRYEKKTLRDTGIRTFHGMEELKKAQDLRVDEFSMFEPRESHATIQELTSQIQELQERVDSLNDSRGISRYRIDLQWKMIPRSQSAGSLSKSSIFVEPRPKPAI